MSYMHRHAWPCRLAWAQVHSTKTSDVDRGVELLQAMLTQESADTRDLKYLLAVGQYRRRHYLDARATLRDLLQVGSGSAWLSLWG